MKSRIIVAASFFTLLASYSALAQITEITTLKNNAPLPHSLFDKYSINDIAANLVERYHLAHEKSSSGSVDYLNKSEIWLSFNSGHLSSILKDAELLNAHQTKQGATFHDDLTLRANLEDSLIGVNLGKGDKANRLRAKYAYLQPMGLENYPKTTFNPNYGNIFAKVKNQLKNRTTFTIGDSMEEGRETLHTFKFRDHIKIQSKYSQIPYWEAQVWGDLKLSDIEAFLVNCERFAKVSKNQIKAMLDAHLPVYFCQMDPHLQNIKAGKKVTAQDLKGNLFLATEDTENPIIKNIQHRYEKSRKLTVQFEVTDNSGVNFCLLKAFHKQKLIFDDEISLRSIDIKSTKCEFVLEQVDLPLELSFFAKDWYNNQHTLSKKIE